MGFLVSVAAFILAIGVLVTVHEFGHFIVARLMGVKVLRFSIGFGKPLWRRVAGADQVEYVIAALPLGGYVKMLDEREGEVAEHELPRAFNRQPLYKRTAVVLAGPLFNFLFAILAYWIIFIIGIPGAKPLIGEVTRGSYAAQAGLASEDEILFVNGKRTPTWSAATVQLLESVLTDAPVAIEVQNQNGLQRSLTLNVPMNKSLTEPGALLPGIGIVPWRPQIPAVIGELERTSVAWRAGLREGDRLVAADGEPLTDRQAWIALVRANPDKPIITDVRRDGLPLRITITPEAVESGGEVVGRIGAPMVVPEESRAQFERARTVQQHGPVEALGKAAVKTWEMSALTLRLLGKMLTGAVSLKNISGPINIAEYAGITASIGFVFYVSFLAIISVSLGVLNLLPIPILDGGHLFYFLVEFLKGSPVSEEVELIGQRIGILMLFILMSFAFYNDLARLFQ